jgi:pimeloyl-ACP methyl ester carboxylesterase
MKRYLLPLCLLLAPLLVACSSGGQDEGRRPTIPLEACRLTGGVSAQCGELLVYEDRAAAAGRQIPLNIAVLPATGSSNVVEDDPLFLLAGGPGQAAVEAYAQALFLFSDVNRTRDIVLVDQRGTGESNGLNCEVLEDETLPADLPDEEQIALLDQCRVDLSQRAELSLYTTDAFVADLDDVRAALDYDTINLYGASYGTRAALTYMRRFPERVRSVVLDAVAGPELVLFLQMPRDGQRSLDLLFDRCAADAACNEAFPNFRAEYEAADPAGDAPAHHRGRPTVERAARLRAGSRLSVATGLQQPLQRRSSRGCCRCWCTMRTRRATTRRSSCRGWPSSSSVGLYPGLLYAVACSEDAPLIDGAEAASIQAETSFGDFSQRFRHLRHLAAGTIAADFREPLTSDTPALLLSGAADPVTPPEYAEQVAAGLSNSRHIVIPGFGHGVIGAGCMPKVVAEFIRTADPAALDTTCLDELQPPPFFVSFAGPTP